MSAGPRRDVPGSGKPGAGARREPDGAPSPQGSATTPAEPAPGLLPGLTTTLPPETVPILVTPTLPPEARAGGLHPGPLADVRRGDGTLAGLIVTAGIHLALVLGVLFAGRTEGRTKPRPPRELVIETRILEVQAGSPEGMRETGPAYKRREGTRAARRRSPRELHLGTSGRSAPRRTEARDQAGDPSGPDDAADVPSDWGSQTGIDAPPGARSSDDRHGAGGTAEQGALDPCFTQHAQVVAGYRAQVSSKIPPMPRPAFITSDVAQNLITSVRVAIDGSGKIASVSVAKSSGNDRFDAAAADHVRAVASFPAPHKCVMYDKIKGVFRGVVTFTVLVRSR